MIDIIQKGERTHDLTKAELTALLGSEEFETELLAAADRVRQKYVGDEIHLRGLIEFSNICKNNCEYCGIRRDNVLMKDKRFQMNDEQIIDLAKNAADLGFKTIVMQSGENLSYTPERMKHILGEIKKLGVAVTLSVGEKTYEEYAAYKEAGADRYLLRIETTDKDLYQRLDPGMDWDNRHRCLVDLDKLGYEVGSGIMVGLPGQSLESIADDLLYLKKMNIDMAGIGPFIPAPGTPLEGEKGRELHLALRTMALMRLVLPEINIPATTAMEALHPDGRIWALQGGANVIMPNVTNKENKEMYQLYPGKVGLAQEAGDAQKNIADRIKGIGRKIGTGRGDSASWIKKQAERGNSIV